MAFSDNAFLAKLREHADRARRLFSNPQKLQRERMVVRAFLRSIGEAFDDAEIVASGDEPIKSDSEPPISRSWTSSAIESAVSISVGAKTDIAMHNVFLTCWSRTRHRSRWHWMTRRSSSPTVCQQKPCVMAPPPARAWTPWSTSIFTIGNSGRLRPPVTAEPLPPRSSRTGRGPCFKPKAGDRFPCSLCPMASCCWQRRRLRRSSGREPGGF